LMMKKHPQVDILRNHVKIGQIDQFIL